MFLGHSAQLSGGAWPGRKTFYLLLPCLDESQLRFDPVFDDSPGIRAA